MNLFIKQKQTCREQTWGCQGGGDQAREGLGVSGQQMQTGLYRMDKQQSPTVQHRELYSISCDKPQWKRILKKECIHMYN